jgi:hypothetical protein
LLQPPEVTARSQHQSRFKFDWSHHRQRYLLISLISRGHVAQTVSSTRSRSNPRKPVDTIEQLNGDQLNGPDIHKKGRTFFREAGNVCAALSGPACCSAALLSSARRAAL